MKNDSILFNVGIESSKVSGVTAKALIQDILSKLPDDAETFLNLQITAYKKEAKK